VRARYVHRTRVGRRNHYEIEVRAALKHGPVRHRRVASIVALLGPEPAASVKARSPRPATARPSRARGRAPASTVGRSSRRRAA
jgi:hypothetical protein